MQEVMVVNVLDVLYYSDGLCINCNYDDISDFPCFVKISYRRSLFMVYHHESDGMLATCFMC